MSNIPQVLIPYLQAEALSLQQAAAVAQCGQETMRRWCQEHHIGRLVVNRWRVSRVALLMLLEGNGPALTAYLAGDRTSELVTAYYLRSGIPLRTLGGPNV